jgi:hypothetical protein
METITLLVFICIVVGAVYYIYGEDTFSDPYKVLSQIKKDTGIAKDCKVSDWREWSACENGKKKRNRVIIEDPLGDGNACPSLVEEVDCIEDKDCEVSEWSEWGTCTSGKQTRTRTVNQEKLGNGKDCPVLSEEQTCLDSQGLLHGEPFRCKGDPVKVNRYIKENTYSWIPNPENFFSWYKSWNSIKRNDIDCEKLKDKGSQISSGPGVGKKSLKCLNDTDPAKVYNFDSENQTYALYKNPTVAQTYDPEWSSAPVVDCSLLTETKPIEIMDAFANPELGHDYWGNDIEYHRTIKDPNICGELCLKNPNCKLFTMTHNISESGCWLKSKAENKTPSSQRIHYFKK